MFDGRDFLAIAVFLFGDVMGSLKRVHGFSLTFEVR